MKQLKILNNTPVCENFWGNGAIYHCYAEMPDANHRQYSQELAELEADRAGQMRLKFARTFYGFYGYDRARKAWTWETPECQALYCWLQRMKDRGIAVALNTGWCCPGDVNSTSWNGESPFTVPGDWKASVQKFGDFVSETVHQFIEVRGFTNIKILTLFTEPQHPSGSYTKEQQEAFGGDLWELQMHAWKDCVDAASAALKRDGRRDKVLLMGPNEGSTVTSQMVKWVAEHPTDIDIYSSHNYQFSKDVELQPGIPCGPQGKVPLLSLPGGRIYQKVTLQKNKNYTLKVWVRWHLPDALHVSGNVIIGAFSTEDGTVNTGSEPTNRLTLGSTAMLDPAFAEPGEQEYSVTFNAGEHTEAFVGIYHDIKQQAAEVILCKAELTEQGKGEQLLQNADFANDFKNWQVLYAGGSADYYIGWCQCCNTALQYVPKGKLFIFDEYNNVYDRNNSRKDHGANIVSAALAFMNSGCSGSMLWTLFDQQWPNNHTTNNDSFVDGDHRCGVAPVLTKTKVPHLSYYAFGLLSRYTGGWGSKVYKGTYSLNLQATLNELPDGNFTVVVVNNKARADSFTLEFEKPLQKTLHRHRFNPAVLVPDDTATLPGIDAEIKVESQLQDDIAPYSVTVYTTIED